MIFCADFCENRCFYINLCKSIDLPNFLQLLCKTGANARSSLKKLAFLHKLNFAKTKKTFFLNPNPRPPDLAQSPGRRGRRSASCSRQQESRRRSSSSLTLLRRRQKETPTEIQVSLYRMIRHFLSLIFYYLHFFK